MKRSVRHVLLACVLAALVVGAVCYALRGGIAVPEDYAPVGRRPQTRPDLAGTVIPQPPTPPASETARMLTHLTHF